MSSILRAHKGTIDIQISPDEWRFIRRLLRFHFRRRSRDDLASEGLTKEQIIELKSVFRKDLKNYALSQEAFCYLGIVLFISHEMAELSYDQHRVLTQLLHELYDEISLAPQVN